MREGRPRSLRPCCDAWRRPAHSWLPSRPWVATSVFASSSRYRPLPLLNALPEVDAAIKRRSFKTVGIIGTRMVMETRLYGAISSAAVVVPEGEEFEAVQQNYSDMAIAGRVNDAQRRVFFAAGERLCRDRGAEVVLLGGTDLFLAFQGRECGFPVLDCADVHVEAIYRRSLAHA